jgi:short subunit dehydrogenase-like uncharacterized protein
LTAPFAPRYGRELNYTCFLEVPDEATALKYKATSSSAKAEEKALRAAGKYYAPGEGPSVDELLDAETGKCKVSTTYTFIAEADEPEARRVQIAFTGGDGYYETARMAVETALCLALHRERVSKVVRGGVLTGAISCGEILYERLLASGIKYEEEVIASGAERRRVAKGSGPALTPQPEIEEPTNQ